MSSHINRLIAIGNPTETGTQPVPTGGAISQPQSSMVGLLGFCIVGLVML